jgi:hypothetical protein
LACLGAACSSQLLVGPLTIDAEIKKLLLCPGFGKCSPENFQLLVIAQNVGTALPSATMNLVLHEEPHIET